MIVFRQKSLIREHRHFSYKLCSHNRLLTLYVFFLDGLT
nr:MAG TPA: hypothetical protein [Caudoviricetes sp.]